MPRGNRSIFICHASEDKPRIVYRLAKDLEVLGADVWIDDWEIRPGDSLRARIEQGITGCRYFFVVLSKRSLDKPWVKWELDAATMRDIEGAATIVPIVYGQVPITSLPIGLRAKRFVRFTAGQGARYDAAFDELRSFIGERHARWRVHLCGGHVDVLAARPDRVVIEAAWSSRTSPYLDWTEITTWYDIFVSGLVIENYCSSSIVIENGAADALIQEKWRFSSPFLAQIGEVGGSPRTTPLDYSGFRYTDGAGSHSSHRAWLRKHEPYRILIKPGSQAEVGVKLGGGMTKIEEETGRLDLANASGLANREWLSPYVSESCDQLRSGCLEAASEREVLCPIRVNRDNIGRPDQSARLHQSGSSAILRYHASENVLDVDDDDDFG